MCMAIQVSARGDAKKLCARRGENDGRMRHAAGAEIPENVHGARAWCIQARSRSVEKFTVYIPRSRIRAYDALASSLVARSLVLALCVCVFHERAHGMARRNTARPTNFWRLVSTASAATAATTTTTAATTTTTIETNPMFSLVFETASAPCGFPMIASRSFFIAFRAIFRFRNRVSTPKTM